MELVAGATLRGFIGDESIPLTRRLRWITDVARALGAAHQLGLVHRDIKPENVMVREDGFVKVLDFGIARRAAADETLPSASGPLDLAALEKLAISRGTLTAEGAVVGTPMYMAPEQLQGEVVDGRADQFSWAVLAHEVLTGKIPWEGEGVMVLAQILSHEVPSLVAKYPAIPESVDVAIRKALTKEPAERFRTMEEIAEALEPFAASLGGATTRPDVPALVRDPSSAPIEHVSLSGPGASMQTGVALRTAGTQAALERPRRRRTILGIAVLAMVAFGSVGIARLLARPGPAVAIADAAPLPEPASQLSANHDAASAFRAGMQAFRDASLGSAQRELARAVEIDPLFALAHLRLALLHVVSGDPATSAELEPAWNSRASLSARDQTLLDAFEPYTRSPPDLEETRQRLERAVQKYPGDTDLLFQLALARDNASAPAKALEALDAVSAQDPKLAVAWFAREEIELELDEGVAARATLDKCVKISPGATTCLSDLATLQANAGQCEDLVATSRRIIALVPTAPLAYRRLADGLAGSWQPLDSVRAAFQQRWDHEDPSLRESSRANGEAALALLSGDFAGADRLYEQLETLVPRPSDAFRFGVAYPRMLIALELGQSSKAARLAQQYVAKRAAWWSEVAYDNSIFAEAVELAAGAVTRTAFEKLRDEWLARNPTTLAASRWIDAYALPTQTREDALSAIESRPASRPLVSALYLTPAQGEAIGRTYVLAGQLDEGVRWLTQSAVACDAIDGPAIVFTMWATLELGDALAARGDHDAACAAYGRVLARWGTGKPSSRTATKAAAQQRVLGCTR